MKLNGSGAFLYMLAEIHRVSYDRSNIVAESGLPLGCAHIGGKSTYAISCVSPTTACATPRRSVAYSLYLLDLRINIHVRLCAPVTLFV
jgi:hypothetical protein